MHVKVKDLKAGDVIWYSRSDDVFYLILDVSNIHHDIFQEMLNVTYICDGSINSTRCSLKDEWKSWKYVIKT